jgi:alkanesulfonate monooxygenase SsuD/methylene tetrahydromethanopterin reductase-like flavin-dependent oxidoreductase (luciferase family)
MPVPTAATTTGPTTSNAAGLQLGVLLFNQASTWPEMLNAARLVDRAGYAHLWAWDHINAIFGDWDQPIFDGWGLLFAYAVATEHARLGLFVGANTLRNPGIQAKNATTLDHISNGRAILGIGGAWNEKEHESHGIEFGASPGQRLDWLDESVGLQRRLFDGELVTSAPGGHYSFMDAHQLPLPIQSRLPIMIGGSGEKKTLRTVARYADMWNAMGSLDVMAHKVDVLRRHCDDVGRDIADIEFTLGVKVTIRDTEAEAKRVLLRLLEHNRTPASLLDEDSTFWYGSPEQIAERLIPYVKLGFRTAITEQPAPYDIETLERFIGEVRPLVDGA